MQNLKSYQFYTGLLTELYRDIADDYNVAQRVRSVEMNYISQRLNTEGISFLTKTLPAVGKAIDIALSQGTVLKIPGFKTSRNSALPKFLGWLLERVFDTQGVELACASPVAIKHLRQFLYLLYKLQIPHAPRTVQKVLDAFVETDKSLSEYDTACQMDPIIPKVREIISSIMGNIDPRDILPCHGPGSVATGEQVTEKRTFSRLYNQLEQYYPFTEYFCFSLSHVCDTLPNIGALEELSHATAKVVLVPKDSRGPRLISSEPLEIQWIQQGLGPVIEARIESHWLTRGFVNFTDQRINQDLALAGSLDGSWVTLDMKDASDRVSTALVESVFCHCPDLLAAMLACRSSHTRLPSGEVIALNKFAPMGSRLCFPVEALIFYTLILGSLHLNTGLSLRKLTGRVFVYGDDIIMRKEDYLIALQTLPKFGLMFNPKKCCVAGFFRESCGVDAYRGVNVTPTRVSTAWNHRRREPEVISSYVALRNALRGRGYFKSAAYIESNLLSVYGNIPHTDRFIKSRNDSYVSQAGGPAFVADTVPAAQLNKGFKRRVNGTGYLEIKSYISRPVKEEVPRDDWSELLRRFSDNWPFKRTVGTRGGFYAFPRRNCLKRGWMAI